MFQAVEEKERQVANVNIKVSGQPAKAGGRGKTSSKKLTNTADTKPSTDGMRIEPVIGEALKKTAAAAAATTAAKKRKIAEVRVG